MPSACPLPQAMEDKMICICESTFADHLPMVVGPTPNLWIELIDQIGSRQAKPGFNRCSDSVHPKSHLIPAPQLSRSCTENGFDGCFHDSAAREFDQQVVADSMFAHIQHTWLRSRTTCSRAATDARAVP